MSMSIAFPLALGRGYIREIIISSTGDHETINYPINRNQRPMSRILLPYLVSSVA